MNLLTNMSIIANQTFKDLEEARDFFIKIKFSETLGSSDIEFAISHKELCGYDSKYNLARNAYEILKGLPTDFNRAENDLTSRLLRVRHFFTSTIDVPKVEDANFTKKAYKALRVIEYRGKELRHIASYLKAQVFTDYGLRAINSYFSKTPTNTFRFIDGIEPIKMDKYEAMGIILLSISHTTRVGDKLFNEQQKRALTLKLSRYSNVKVEEAHEGRELNSELAKEVQHAYTEAAKGREVHNLEPIVNIYKNLRQGLQDNKIMRVYNMCLLIKCCKKYFIQEGMTVK